MVKCQCGFMIVKVNGYSMTFDSKYTEGRERCCKRTVRDGLLSVCYHKINFDHLVYKLNDTLQDTWFWKTGKCMFLEKAYIHI